MNNNLAILVISCDNYSDLWGPFFTSLTKYWPDVPFKIYLGTNYKDFSYPGVEVIKAGNDISWADNVRTFLSEIAEDFVLLFLDDIFICDVVNTERIVSLYEFALRENVDVLKLILPRRTRHYKKEKQIFYMNPLYEYCIDTSISIWRKSMLLSFLKPGYSAWDFEVINSEEIRRKGQYPGLFLTVNKDQFSYINGVIQKKWVPSSLKQLQKNGIRVDISHRLTMDLNEVIWENLKTIARIIIPFSIRIKIKKFLICLGLKGKFVSPR